MKNRKVIIAGMLILICMIVSGCFSAKEEGKEILEELESFEGEDVSHNQLQTEESENTDEGEDKDEYIYNPDFAQVKEELSLYGEDAEELEKAGCFVLMHGRLYGGKAIWDDFYEQVQNKEPARIIIVQFTIEGDPVLDYLSYDGKEFYHVQDTSRDKWAGDGERYYEERYPCLLVFDRQSDNGDKDRMIVLTDEESLSDKDMEKAFETDGSLENGRKVRFLAWYFLGNINSEIDGQISYHEVESSFDESAVLIPEKEVASLIVINGWTGERKQYSETESPEELKKMLDLYENLDFMPDDALQERSGYTYAMQLYGEDGKLLQQVIPYKDAVVLNGTIYNGNMNGTCVMLLQYLGGLDW